MNKLLECTKGPWRVLSDYSNGPHSISGIDGGVVRKNGICVPKIGEGKSNAALIAAAFDHALIGWALTWLRGDMWFAADRNEMGFIPEAETGEIFWLPADPFGFPTLTDDLRARLIAEMEGAK